MERNLTEIAEDLNRQSGYVHLPSLIFITDNETQPYPESVIEKMPSGSMVILRDYDLESRRELGQALKYICEKRGIKFVVAGDLTLSLMVKADGIHIPEHALHKVSSIREEYPDYFITASVHNEAAIKHALEGDVDALLLSPIFPTKSHPETFKDINLTIGLNALKIICSKYEVPIYALGGITIETAPDLSNSGVTGIAAIRGLET